MNIENRKAYHDYFIEEQLECGISLTGDEIKSIRLGKASIKESWISADDKQLTIKGMHITHYEKRYNYNVVDEKRDRKLLAHKNEIIKLNNSVQRAGYTIIPLKVYINNYGKCKVLIGLCKGKHNYDKREALKEKQIKRDIDRSYK